MSADHNIEVEHRLTRSETRLDEHEEAHRALQNVLERDAERQREKQESENRIREQLKEQAATFVTVDKYETESRAGADAIAAIGKEVDRRLAAIEQVQAGGAEKYVTRDELERRVQPVENKQSNMDGKMAVWGSLAAFVASGITGLIVYALTN